MSRRVKLLAAGVLLLAAVRAGVAWQAPPPSEVAQELFAFDPAAVARVELSQGQRRLVLTKAGQGWEVASAGSLPVRAGAVESLLRHVRGWRRVRLAGKDPAQHEEWFLTPERGRHLRFLDAEGTLLAEVLVGRLTGADRDLARDQNFRLKIKDLGLLVRVPEAPGGPLGDAVWVVNDFLTQELNPQARAWFLRPLLAFEPGQVQRLRIERPRGGCEVILRPGALRFAQDPRPPDANRVYGLLSRLRELVVLGPGDGSPRPAGATRLRLQRAKGPALQLSLWRREGAWQAEVEGRAGKTLRVELQPALAQQAAEVSLQGLARTRLFLSGTHALRRVHWFDGRGERSLIRLPRGPADALVPGAEHQRHAQLGSQAQRELLEALLRLEVVRWAAPETRRPPAASLTLLEGQRLRRCELSAPEGGLRLVWGGGLPAPAWVREADLKAWSQTFDRLVREQ